MVLIGQLVSITQTVTAQVWRFPQHPFFEYEPHDEEFCRKYGIGNEVQVQSTITIPTATLTGMQYRPDGTVTATFKTWPNYSKPLG